ncbi:sugar phosphate nucleotidyltransferase [Photobacterium nomapromontoriensis]|uniref:sugar phosphate nucleotidyltransferase n=1 Tax=Photobacterium nomapromontoriensis TaxID=2910237 RepID=UPI003D0ABAA5
MKGMILAAGKGTRVKPITHTIPKPMIPILGKPVMESMIQLFASHGIDKIVINTSHLAEVIENYFSDGHHFNVQLSYSYEGEMLDGKFVSKALGSAGGMRKIQDFSGFFDDTFVVVCGDAWIDLDLTEAVRRHKEKGGIATIVTRDVDLQDVTKYGVVVTDSYGKVISFQEKPAVAEALSTQINTGIYIFEPAIFDLIPEGQEYDIGSELFPDLVEKGINFYATSMEFQWLDVGNVSDIWTVTSEILQGKVPGYPIPGTQVKPGIWVGINTVFNYKECNIIPPVIISSGSEIQSGATIEGPAVIGANCKIESDAIVKQSLVSDYIHIASSAYVDNKTVFGDYFISHDGYTQSLTELDAVHMLNDRRQVQPLIGSIGSLPAFVSSIPDSIKETILTK